MKDIIICDIDGTLCTDEHRNHILQKPCPGCKGRGYVIPEDETTQCRACWGSGCQRGSAEWDEYFSLCHLDPPVPAVIAVLQGFRHLSESGGIFPNYQIHLMTARVDTVKDKTLAWLDKHYVPYDSIRFRPADSRLQDNVLKTKWADELGGPERVLFVLEDRQRVVDAWRTAGYTCFQVAKGDF